MKYKICSWRDKQYIVMFNCLSTVELKMLDIDTWLQHYLLIPSINERSLFCTVIIKLSDVSNKQ